MRTKNLWLLLALLVSSFALVAAGCGGDDEEAGSETGAATEGAAEAAEQVITINWISEPPSLDPGLASDVTVDSVNNGVVTAANDLGNGYVYAKRDARGKLQLYAGVEQLS